MDRDKTARDIAYLIDEGRSYVETPKGITIHIPDSLPAAYKILAAIEPAIRVAALEEAAREAERPHDVKRADGKTILSAPHPYGLAVAAAIRALKG